jgi:macrodomain Ter protein organizer (MatP/YcbG family)
MTEQSENSRPGKDGKIQSFYVRYEILMKLARLAEQRGVTRNRMLSVLVEEAEESRS